MLPGSKQEKHIVTFSNSIPTSQPSSSSPSRPRYYSPFTTRTPWLATVLIAVLACIAVLETAVQTGYKGGRNDDDLLRRWTKRQDDGLSSGVVEVVSSTESTSSTASQSSAEYQTSSEYIAISTEIDNGATQTTASSKYLSISSSSSAKSPHAETAATTASDGEGGYVAISTSSVTSVLFNVPQSEFISISTASESTSSKESKSSSTTVIAATSATSNYIEITTASAKSDDVGVTTSTPKAKGVTTSTPASGMTLATAAQSEYVGITTITLGGTPVQVLPTTYTSDGQKYTSYQSIDSEEAPVASRTIESMDQSVTEGLLGILTSFMSTIEVTLTTSLQDGSLETVTQTSVVATSAPTAPGEVKATQIQIGTTFTEMDYFTASYLPVLAAVLLKSIWAMVFTSLKMMEPFYHLARPEGATAKDTLLADFLSTGYSINHIKHVFSGHWVMLASTFAYLGFAILAPLAGEASTVVATAYCTTPEGSQQPCTPVWVLNYSFVRELEAVLCFIAFLVVVIIFLSRTRKSGIFANPSSLATMASLLSHEETLNDLRQLDQSSSDDQLAHALYNNHYTLASYEVDPSSGSYRYGICKTSSSSTSNPYTLDRFRNFSAQSETHYSALQKPSASDYSLPASFPTSMAVYPRTSAITTSTSTSAFSLPKRTIRDILFLLFLFGLLGVVIAYYLDGSSSGFNDFFNSHTFGPGFILTSAAVMIDFHFKTLEREVRILVPYKNLGARMAKPENSVLLNIGGTAWDNFPKALYRGEWFHALIAGTAVLSDFLIVAVAGVPYSTAQVWQAFLASAYVSMGILGVMILSVFGIFWWRAGIRKLKMPREPDTLLSVWMMLCDEGNKVRAEFDGWETTGGIERDRACKGRASRYQGGWVQDENGSGRWRWCVGADGDGRAGMVVGYG